MQNLVYKSMLWIGLCVTPFVVGTFGGLDPRHELTGLIAGAAVAINFTLVLGFLLVARSIELASQQREKPPTGS